MGYNFRLLFRPQSCLSVHRFLLFLCCVVFSEETRMSPRLAVLAGRLLLTVVAASISVLAQAAPQTSSADETRSEEHTSELQSPYDIVCRLLLEKKNTLLIVIPYNDYSTS